jgi:NAD(P)-dependent dehydrogenase (short-subunit alcohol dehydrogenase family)
MMRPLARTTPSLEGRRVLITGAARGIGAALAERLHRRGAQVAIVGLEEELLAEVAGRCGDAHWSRCDVAERAQVERAVEDAVGALGGLDVVVANAGIGAQLPLVGGDPKVMEQTLQVNVLGVYYTLRAAGPHISHRRGYALPIASVGAVLHLPLMGAYSASKAAVEALGNTLRIELRPSGARVGVAYFTEIDTDMTSRGFGTEAAEKLAAGVGWQPRVAPLDTAIDALERGIRRRSRRVVAPSWAAPLLPLRMFAQPFVDVAVQRGLSSALDIARREDAPFTTPQPDEAAVLSPDAE